MANVYLNSKVDLSTTDNTVLYTVPSNSRAIIKSLLVSEDAGSGTTITVTLTSQTGTVFSLFKVKAVGANTTVELLTHPLVINEAEILKFNAATANRLHVVASFLEIS